MRTPQNCTFVIRCWREETHDFATNWRFSVEEVRNPADRRGFADRATLLHYVEEQLNCLMGTADLRGESK